MTLAPESQIILINAAILLVAYLVVYPSVRGITPMRMVRIDVLFSGLALGIAALLFWGTGTRFSMLFFSTNWAVFSIVTMQIMEAPLFFWFCRDRGMDPFDFDGGE